MAPEYGATMGFFPMDHVTVEYLRQTDRPANKVWRISLLFIIAPYFIYKNNNNNM